MLACHDAIYLGAYCTASWLLYWLNILRLGRSRQFLGHIRVPFCFSTGDSTQRIGTEAVILHFLHHLSEERICLLHLWVPQVCWVLNIIFNEVDHQLFGTVPRMTVSRNAGLGRVTIHRQAKTGHWLNIYRICCWGKCRARFLLKLSISLCSFLVVCVQLVGGLEQPMQPVCLSIGLVLWWEEYSVILHVLCLIALLQVWITSLEVWHSGLEVHCQVWERGKAWNSSSMLLEIQFWLNFLSMDQFAWNTCSLSVQYSWRRWRTITLLWVISVRIA